GGEGREAAAHEREHRTASDELERRMSRIDLPRSGERKQVVAGANVDDRIVVVGHSRPRFVPTGSAILPYGVGLVGCSSSIADRLRARMSHAEAAVLWDPPP